VAQVHALLLLSERPLHAEEIADTLGIARSNASTSLRELQNWEIAKVVHLPGDRRDHFETVKDLFTMFRVIARQRKKREIDPTIQLLRECIAEAGKTRSAEPYTRERLQDLLALMELGAAVYERTEKLSSSSILKIARLGDRAFRLLGVPPE
jgi:DNA-binding transcriptional regulator GbsR (MarR family)